jgi:hypothetical protein
MRGRVAIFVSYSSNLESPTQVTFGTFDVMAAIIEWNSVYKLRRGCGISGLMRKHAQKSRSDKTLSFGRDNQLRAECSI